MYPYIFIYIFIWKEQKRYEIHGGVGWGKRGKTRKKHLLRSTPLRVHVCRFR
jgi:hypothetical protein